MYEKSLEGHRLSIKGLALKSNLLFSSSNDYTVKVNHNEIFDSNASKIWNTDTLQCIDTIHISANPVGHILIHEDSIYITSLDAQIRKANIHALETSINKPRKKTLFIKCIVLLCAANLLLVKQADNVVASDESKLHH